MALLVDNKITNEELKNTYQVDLIGSYKVSANEVNAVINKAYDRLLSFIRKKNNDLTSDEDILLLLDDANKIAVFKNMQATIVENMIERAGSNPIDDYVEDTVRHRLGLSKMNGWQK